MESRCSIYSPPTCLAPNACEDVLFQSSLEHVTNTEDVRYVKIVSEPTTLGWGVEKPIKSETIDAYLAWSPHHFQWMRHRMLVPALLQNHHKHSPGAPQCTRDHVLQQALAGEYPDPHTQVHIKTGGCLWPENDTRVRDLHSGILVEATWGHIPAPVHFTPSAGSRPADHVDHTPTEDILNRINVDNVLQLTTQVLDPWPNHIISLDTKNIPWHQFTVEEFPYLRTCLDQEPIGVTFYTDGTFRDPVEDEIWGKGSWAVVMLWNMPDQSRVWGGHIAGHTNQPDSAFPVEPEGLMCACLWAIQIVAHFSPEIEITFRYDSNEAGRMCQGRSRTTSKHALGSTARSLFQLLENWRMPEYIHVTAHSGEPFR